MLNSCGLFTHLSVTFSAKSMKTVVSSCFVILFCLCKRYFFSQCFRHFVTLTTGFLFPLMFRMLRKSFLLKTNGFQRLDIIQMLYQRRILPSRVQITALPLTMKKPQHFSNKNGFLLVLDTFIEAVIV